MTEATPNRQPRAFRMSRSRRTGDAMIGWLVRMAVVPSTYLLTVPGRKTGQLRTNPVPLVEAGGRRWLVAPYGPVSWVLNTRAAGRVSLRRGRHTLEFSVREISLEEAAPILKRYLAITGPPRRYFAASKDSPVEQFAAEADRHPVFELLPVA